jgi:hypothetical protein
VAATLTPHVPLTGTIVFIVPAAAKITWIEYQPSATATGALYFDAG